MKFQIDRAWLLEKIKAEPDDACVEAGVLHPEAPLPRLINRLSPGSTDLEVMEAIAEVERQAEPYRGIFHAALREVTRIDAGVYECLRLGVAS